MVTMTQSRAIVPAERTREIKYAVRDVLSVADEAAKAGKKMRYLNIGDPNIFDFAPPRHMIEATYEAMKANKLGYAATSGIKEAVEAVRREAQRKGIGSINHVYITSGASEAIDLAMGALVNPGENVLTPAPGYPLYTAILSKLGAVNNPYFLDEGNDWQPDIEDIRSKVNNKTRAIVLINPNNPTGSLYTTNVLEEIIRIAIERNLVILSDEIYDKLVFDGKQHVSTASLSREAKIITFNGLSKSYVVPGFRIGWGIVSGPAGELEEYCEAVRKMERARLSANHPEQYAIKPALEGPQDHLKEMMAKLTRRRDLMVEKFNAISGVSCVKPGGAFYAFPRLEIKMSDSEFVTRLIRETGVVVVPGDGFGQRPGTKHFRVVFLPQEEILAEAFDAIGRLVSKCR